MRIKVSVYIDGDSPVCALYEYHALHAIRMLERVAVRRNVKLAMVNARHTRRSRQPEVEVTADLGLKLAPTSYNLLPSICSHLRLIFTNLNRSALQWSQMANVYVCSIRVWMQWDAQHHVLLQHS